MLLVQNLLTNDYMRVYVCTICLHIINYCTIKNKYYFEKNLKASSTLEQEQLVYDHTYSNCICNFKKMVLQHPIHTFAPVFIFCMIV